MEEPCSIAAAVSIVGEKWTLLVLREAFSGVTRFDEFLRRTGCSSAILSSRLKALVTYGILRRVPYQEPGDRVRDAYRLTRAGVDLRTAKVPCCCATAKAAPRSTSRWSMRWASPLRPRTRCASAIRVMDGGKIVPPRPLIRRRPTGNTQLYRPGITPYRRG